jgi:hypothetical protein
MRVEKLDIRHEPYNEGSPNAKTKVFVTLPQSWYDANPFPDWDTDAEGRVTESQASRDQQKLLVATKRANALPAVLGALGIEGSKASWSRKCGCQCECSPGFTLEASRGKMVFVTLAD